MRYKAESQGDLKAVWNVIDTWTSTYKYHAITGKGAKRWAQQLARDLNKENKISFFYFMADFGEWMLSFPHPKDFCRKDFKFWGRPR